MSEFKRIGDQVECCECGLMYDIDDTPEKCNCAFERKTQPERRPLRTYRLTVTRYHEEGGKLPRVVKMLCYAHSDFRARNMAFMLFRELNQGKWHIGVNSTDVSTLFPAKQTGVEHFEMLATPLHEAAGRIDTSNNLILVSPLHAGALLRRFDD